MTHDTPAPTRAEKLLAARVDRMLALVAKRDAEIAALGEVVRVLRYEAAEREHRHAEEIAALRRAHGGPTTPSDHKRGERRPALTPAQKANLAKGAPR